MTTRWACGAALLGGFVILVAAGAVVAAAHKAPTKAPDVAPPKAAPPSDGLPLPPPPDTAALPYMPEQPLTSSAADMKISLAQAAILGAVQGLTEYLPVSSTGHLILVNHMMGFTPSVDEAHPLTSGFEENKSIAAFDIILHLGTFLAVLGLYRKRVAHMIQGLLGKDPAGLQLLRCLVVAFVPAGIMGALFHHRIEEKLYNPVAVAGALAVGGVLMIVIEHFFWRKKQGVERVRDVTNVRLWQALVIGLAQCLAMWPGTSRSMITILAALVVGLDMLAAAEFSFLLALPTLSAAVMFTGYKHWPDLVQSAGPGAMIVSLIVTAVVAAIAIRGFVAWLTRHGLAPFGVYRIALAGAVFAYFALH